MVRNNQGITLLEVLCSIALLSIILLLVNSFHLFGQKEFVNQTSHLENQSNVRFAINIITKEIRSAETVEVLNNVLTINGVDIYKLDGKVITKNDASLIQDIEEFDVKQDSVDENKITISIASVPSNLDQKVSLSTSLYIRN